MAAQKMTLKIIHSHDDLKFSRNVENFIAQIANPETMQVEFKVMGKPGDYTIQWYYAFILFDGKLEPKQHS